MTRRFTEPNPRDFDTEEEYLEELAYYEQEENLREMENDDRRYERLTA